MDFIFCVRRSLGALPRLGHAAGICVLAAVGCAPVDDASLDAPDTESAPSLALAQEARLVGPDEAYIADVDTTGTGCPEGSAVTSISRDGQVFTTTFSRYEVSVDPGTEVAVRDCQISIRLHSPAGQSYAMHSFYYSGSAYLEDGVSGLQTASYYFQGAAVTSRSVRTELLGPRDAPFLFQDDVETAEEHVWSPCGRDRDLQIITRMRVQNSTPRRTGYMNLSSLDATTKLEFKLAWRKCEEAPAPSPAAPAPPPPSAQPGGTTKPPPRGNQGGAVGEVVDGLGEVVGGTVGGLSGILGGLGGVLGGLLGAR